MKSTDLWSAIDLDRRVSGAKESLCQYITFIFGQIIGIINSIDDGLTKREGYENKHLYGDFNANASQVCREFSFIVENKKKRSLYFDQN